MTAVALVIALYAVWRVAVVIGQRRERARRESFPFRATGSVVRCRCCGRIADSTEMTANGAGPWRAWRCRGGCADGEAGEHGRVV